jgi:PAS domain S-box-containing protein
VDREAELSAAIVAAAPDCVIVIDAAGRVAEFNPAAEATFGYAREQALGRELAELIIPPALRERHRRALARCVETGEGTLLGRRVELPGVRADGSEFQAELMITRVPGPEPTFVGFVRDITDLQRMQDEGAWLAAVVESTDDAVVTKDGRGVITSWNPAAERIYGYTPEEAVGRSIQLLIPTHRAGEEQSILAQIMAGHRIDHYETERVRKDGRTIEVSVTVSPLKDRMGRIVGASVITRDITRRMRGERAQRMLAEAGAVLDRSLDPRSTLQAIAELTVPHLCELCVIDLADDDGHPAGAVAVAAGDPQLANALERLRERYPLDPDGDHPVARALLTGEPELLTELTDDVLEAIAQSDEHLDFMRQVAYRSAMVAPLRARGRTLGVLSVLHLREAGAFDQEDLELLTQLASRAAMAFDNARLYSERSHIAGTLQQSLLPPALPEIPGYDLAGHFRPAGEGLDVGGDFYDVFRIADDENRWALVIGDVCGKGAQAAALTALARHTIRALAREGRTPAEILARLNESMIDAAESGDRYLTVVVALLDVAEAGDTLHVASAGHPSPLRVAAGASAELLPAAGPLAGFYPDAAYVEHEFAVADGETVVFYTDGVTDAAAPQRILSIEELTAALAEEGGRSAAEIAASIDRLATASGASRPRDDIAILALRATPGRNEPNPKPGPKTASAQA